MWRRLDEREIRQNWLHLQRNNSEHLKVEKKGTSSKWKGQRTLKKYLRYYIKVSHWSKKKKSI